MVYVGKFISFMVGGNDPIRTFGLIFSVEVSPEKNVFLCHLA